MNHPKQAPVDSIIPLHGLNHESYEIVFMKPRSFQETTQAIQALRERKIVIMNLTGLTHGLAQRSADFVSGGTHAIAGQQTCLGKDVFMFTPHAVQVNLVQSPLRSQVG